MKYPTILIEEAIIAADILKKTEQGEITGQAIRKPISSYNSSCQVKA